MKTKLAFITFVLILSGSSFAAFAVAQGSIEGTVTDAKGKGVANVTVTLVGSSGKPVATVKTDADGAYTFDNIASGKYKVVANGLSGFKPAFRENVIVEDDETATIDITLVAAAAAPPNKPASGGPATPKPVVQKPQPSGNDPRVAGQVPDLSGTWTLNRAASKMKDQFSMAPTSIKIVQSANELDIERQSSFQGTDSTVKDKFTLDGKESINPDWADSQKRSIAAWSADKASLVITTKISLGDNGEMTIIEVYRLKDKQLVIEARASSFFDKVAETLVFDKK